MSAVLYISQYFHHRRKDYNLARHFEFDFNTAVKCYSRSAAGQSVVGSDGVRDLKTLEKTVEYLFSE